MGTFTKHDALIGGWSRTLPAQQALIKSLKDAGVDNSDKEYTAADKKQIAKAAIMVLRKLIVLSSDSQGKSSQGYQVEKLEKRIKALADENDLEDFVGVPTVDDGSNRW